MSTRRNFLKMATMAGGSALLMRNPAWPFAQSPTQIRKFVVPLQGLGPTGIPVATPNTTLFPGEDYYQIRVGEFTQACRSSPVLLGYRMRMNSDGKKLFA